MKIDSTTVQLVLAIEAEGSISRAADKLQLAVAAASRRLTDLEQQLGARLFKRLPHGVKVTDAGTKLLTHIHQIDNLFGRLEGEARMLHQGREGRIILGAPKAAIIEFLAGDIARIQAQYPKIALKIVEENSQIVQQLLRDKVIDIGIYEKTSGFLDLERFDYRQDQLVLVYSRRHFTLSSTQVSVDDILDLPVVSLGKGSAVLTALQRAYRSRGRFFSNDFAASGFDTMFALVRHGLGVGFMPPQVLGSFRADSDIASIPLAGDWGERAYVLSQVEGNAQGQLLRNVVQQLLCAQPDAEQAPDGR